MFDHFSPGLCGCRRCRSHRAFYCYKHTNQINSTCAYSYSLYSQLQCSSTLCAGVGVCMGVVKWIALSFVQQRNATNTLREPSLCGLSRSARPHQIPTITLTHTRARTTNHKNRLHRAQLTCSFRFFVCVPVLRYRLVVAIFRPRMFCKMCQSWCD